MGKGGRALWVESANVTAMPQKREILKGLRTLVKMLE